MLFRSRASSHRAPQEATQAPRERPGLLDDVRLVLRTAHYSRRTEATYVYWIKRFASHYRDRDPAQMGADEIRSFVSHLAVQDRVTASTQNQALCALVFLYGRVIGKEVGVLEGIDRAKTPTRLPVVLSRDVTS